jgi:hypothetical protein
MWSWTTVLARRRALRRQGQRVPSKTGVELLWDLFDPSARQPPT